MSKISATIVADSINPQGDRLTSLLITFPRILLSEVNTHRILKDLFLIDTLLKLKIRLI